MIFPHETAKYVMHNVQTHLNVTNMDILILGCRHHEQYWFEAILLELGAKHITCLELKSDVVTSSNLVSIISPGMLWKKFMNNELYDLVFSLDTLKALGMGQYGVGLNPWADLTTMAKAWCVSKPGGKAFVTIPTGNDLLEFNTGRVYGRKRIPNLFANWKYVNSTTYKPHTFVKDSISFHESFFVLEKWS